MPDRQHQHHEPIAVDVVDHTVVADPHPPRFVARYFYKPPVLRTLEEIKQDIFALEQETEGLLQQIVEVA